MVQDGRPPNPRYVPVSQLHSLHLNSIRFGGSCGLKLSYGTFVTLLQVFHRRQRAGVQLPYVSISKSINITEEDIQILNGAMKKVVWDEEKAYDSGSDLGDDFRTCSEDNYGDDNDG